MRYLNDAIEIVKYSSEPIYVPLLDIGLYMDLAIQYIMQSLATRVATFYLNEVLKIINYNSVAIFLAFLNKFFDFLDSSMMFIFGKKIQFWLRHDLEVTRGYFSVYLDEKINRISPRVVELLSQTFHIWVDPWDHRLLRPLRSNYDL